jgi:hypothetical protein
MDIKGNDECIIAKNAFRTLSEEINFNCAATR